MKGAMLNLASPACAGLQGQPVVGQARVCRYGDSVTNAHMRGDGFRLRHDGVKMKIKSLLQWAGVRAECEVFNEFAGLIPQQGLNRIQRGQRRQGLVPDFKLEGERGGEDKGRPHKEKHIFFLALPEKGGGLPMPEFFGPFSPS